MVFKNSYRIVPQKGHYLIYKDDIFIESCDSNELNETMYRLISDETETTNKLRTVSF